MVRRWMVSSGKSGRLGSEFVHRSNDIDSSAQSPCIGNCCLDDDLTCLGCFRSLEEIKEWGVADDHRRRVILQNAKQRRAASQS
jgi:predicted Fe-S protein YdhL (DUF1289 family)